MGQIMPDKIPEMINISGEATKWIEKGNIHYHIPIPELIIYVFLTFLQFHYTKKNPPLEKFLYHSKLALIIFCGSMMPLSTYVYSMKYIPTIWYLVGPVVGFLVIYIFILAMFTGVLVKPPKSKASASLPATRKKKKKKK